MKVNTMSNLAAAAFRVKSRDEKIHIKDQVQNAILLELNKMSIDELSRYLNMKVWVNPGIFRYIPKDNIVPGMTEDDWSRVDINDDYSFIADGVNIDVNVFELLKTEVKVGIYISLADSE